MANDYILEVSWGCPSDKWPINGLFQFDQAKAISDSGKRVVFLALDLRSIRRWRKWGLNKFNKNGIDVYEYNFPLGGFKPSIKYAVQDFAFRRSIKTIVKELGHPSCVHIHCCQQAISVSDYCLANNIPYIITEHITPLNEGAAIEQRKKETLEHAKQLICVSNALAKDMKNTYGVDSVVIPNIVDLTEFKYTPKQKTDIFRFLSAASVNYGKGFDILAKAYAKFLEDAKDLSTSGYKDTHLTIMGDGPELNNIKELANSLGISDKITFTGSYVRSDFAKELAKSDCFVLPSRSETFGIVYIEALATGTPVIATRCGGPEDFVNDENGMLVDVDDVDGLALSMSKVALGKAEYNLKKTAEECHNIFSSRKVGELILGNIIQPKKESIFLKETSILLENGNKRTVYEKIFNEPGEKLVEVTGIVKEFQKRKIPTELIKDSKGNVHYKDGYDHIIDYDVEMVEKARISGKKVRPFYFVGRWTLIIDAHIGNEVIGDGHIWLVEDLGNAIQARENDRVLIEGHVVRYNKHRGKETDYCVRPTSVKILN